MSVDAIRAVTRAMRALLLSQLPPGRKVTLSAPGESLPSDASGVNLYLYRVGESPFARNLPFPGDRGGAEPDPEPVLSLELFYLLTPFGPKPNVDDVEDDAQRALGEAMLVLHENALLTRTHLPGFDADTELPAYVLDSYEDVAIRLQPASFDELTKLWGTTSSAYRLSVVYQVSLVQLRPTTPPRAQPGVVQETGVQVITTGPPVLSAVEPPSGALAELVGGQVRARALTLTGARFTQAGSSPSITVGGVPAAPAGAVEERRIEVDLPTDVPAGPDVDVRVRRDGGASAAIPFRISPWLGGLRPARTALDAAEPADATLILTGTGLAPAQEVRISGGGHELQLAPLAGADAHEIRVTAPPGADRNAAPGAGQLPNGMYAVRLRLTGGELSNLRRLEVVPRVDAGGGTGYDPVTRVLTLAGARLDGADVRVVLDGQEYGLGPQATGTEVTRTFGAPLAPGAHTVAVVVDGRSSRTRTLTL